MGRNLVLAGFMGTGKTTVGRLVAARLQLAFVDTDAEIERLAGRRIADIFASDGEATFRRIEADVCLRIAARRDQVVATGGGALLNPAVYGAFAADSLIVCLTCDLDEIIRRVGRDPARPLFAAERERLALLLASRAALYAGLPHQIDTTTRTASEVAEEIVQLWKRGS